MLPTAQWKADFDERFPIYQQIVHEFQRALVTEHLSTGDRIPSIRDLSIDLKVNTNTVQKAYQELEKNNIIYSQRGMGYFVREDESLVDAIMKEMVRESVAQFVSDMRGLGLSNQVILSTLEKRLKEDITHAVTNKES